MRPTLRRARAAVLAEGRDRLGLRAVILVLSLLASALTQLAAPAPVAGGGPVRLPLILLGLLVVAAALAPDTALPLVLIACHIAVWGLFVPRPEQPGDITAPVLLALLLLGIHQAAAATGVFPPGARIPRSAGARWLRWTGMVGAITVTLAVAAALLTRSAPPGLAVVTVLGLVGLGAGAVAAYVKSI